MQVLKQHPDLGGDNDRAQLINEAYSVLSDPDRRARYDADCARLAAEAAGKRPAGDESAATTEPPSAAGRCLFCGTPAWGASRDDTEAVCRECDSPLHAARRLRWQRSMRRMLPRIGRHLGLDIHRQWPAAHSIAANMQDLSLNGMRFTTAVPFEIDDLLKVDCELCAALGRVTYCRRTDSGRYVSGIEFLTLRLKSLQGTFVSASA